MVVLNGKVSNWADVTAGVPQGSILDPLLINDLATGLSSNANEMNNDLAKINNWAFRWKMNFNADLSKQAQEVIFSQKSKKKVIFHYFLITFKFHNFHLRNILILYLPTN